MPAFSSLLMGAAVLAVLALPGRLLLAALFVRPQRGVLLIAALAPFNGLLLILPLPSFAAGWKEVLTLVVAVAAVFAPVTARRSHQGHLPGWAAAAGGLLALSLASGAVVGGVRALVALKIGFFYLILAVTLWRCPLSDRERDRLVSILMLDGVLTAVYGLWQQLAGPERLAALGYQYDTVIRTAGGQLRSFSTFNQPFPFGLFVMLVVLVATPVALSELSRLRNQLFLLAVPVLLAGMVTSIVRASYLGLAVGGLWLVLFRYRPLLLMGPPALLGLLFVPVSWLGPLLSSTSLGQRTSGWSSTFGQLLANPLGAGIGASGSAAEKASKVASGVEVSAYQPDNFYYKTVLELGVLGLWMLVLLLVSAARVSLAVARRASGRDAALAAGVGASVVAAAVASTVSTYFEIFPLDLYFWLLLGVVACIDSQPSCAPDPVDSPSRSRVQHEGALVSS